MAFPEVLQNCKIILLQVTNNQGLQYFHNYTSASLGLGRGYTTEVAAVTFLTPTGLIPGKMP